MSWQWHCPIVTSKFFLASSRKGRGGRFACNYMYKSIMPSILYIWFYSDYLWTGLDYHEYQIVPGSISEHEFWVVSAHAAFCTNSHSCFLFPAFAVTLWIVLHFIDACCLPFCVLVAICLATIYICKTKFLQFKVQWYLFRSPLCSHPVLCWPLWRC